MPEYDLYYARSANSLRAALAIELCEVSVRKHEVDLAAGEQRAEWFITLNPAGTVPTLVESARNQKMVLTQSGAIMEYLFDQYRPDMWPDSPSMKAQCVASTLCALSDISVQNTLARYLGEIPEASSFVFDRMMNMLKAAFEPARRSPYLCGSSATMADYAHLPVVYMREPSLRRRQGFEHVTEWLERMLQQPAVVKAISYAGRQIED